MLHTFASPLYVTTPKVTMRSQIDDSKYDLAVLFIFSMIVDTLMLCSWRFMKSIYGPVVFNDLFGMNTP